MPEDRTTDTPVQHVEFSVLVNGTAVADTNHLLALSVVKTVNRISYARLEYQDGSPSEENFPLSNQDLFVPGAEIDIQGGSINEKVSLFKGIITKHGIRIKSSGAPRLIIECSHKAVKMHGSRKNKYYYESADSDIISQLISDAGITADEVENTSATHTELVRFNCTDWDFLVMRAEANGLLVFTNDDKIKVKSPSGGNPVLQLIYGDTVHDFSAEMDARNQYETVKSYSWSQADQALIEQESSAADIPAPGNIDSSTLAEVMGMDEFRLQHGGIQAENELKKWADSQKLKSQLSRMRGTVKIDGTSSVNPGDTVTINGVGDRFSGDHYITGVKHDFGLAEGWKTVLQFGTDSKWHAEEFNGLRQEQNPLVSSVNGLHIGVVTSLDDPDGEFRVKVKVPVIDNEEEGSWTRIASLDAGDSRGIFFRPEVDDEVVVGFINDDPRNPVIIGMLHSSAKASPISQTEDNNEKGYVSRENIKFIFDEDKKSIVLETPGGNKITISDDDSGIKLEDQNSNSITMDSNGIKLNSNSAIELVATTDLKLSGMNLSFGGDGSLKVEGSGSVEISSSGTTTIKGSMVQIN